MSVVVERKCDLCGKTDRTVEWYIGGYINFAHHKCGDIGDKAIELYLRRLIYDFNGLRILSDDIQKIIKKEDEKAKKNKK